MQNGPAGLQHGRTGAQVREGGGECGHTGTWEGKVREHAVKREESRQEKMGAGDGREPPSESPL